MGSFIDRNENKIIFISHFIKADYRLLYILESYRMVVCLVIKMKT